MTIEDPYELVVTPPAARAIQAGQPEAVAAAVIEFLTGALISEPRPVGNPLRGDLAGIHSARRGTYRVLSRINDTTREVIVLRIGHRRDAFRPRVPAEVDAIPQKPGRSQFTRRTKVVSS